jgi:pimeloyl-ACP methyl ester carboxylesterase
MSGRVVRMEAGESPVVGSYELLRRLGVGGMGEVWLGQHVLTRGLGAVKQLRPTARVRGLGQEARAIARLSHPHVVPLFEVGEKHLVTAFIDGSDLERRLQSPIEPSVALRIARQVAAALAHAHERNVIHRDVKPSNILLDGASNAFLADFGIAELLDEKRAPRAGTAAYMAPEQKAGKRAGPASDQYALACTLLAMLLGGDAQPFGPRALERLPHDAPPRLLAALARALEDNPAARFPSMGDFSDELAAVNLEGVASAARLAAMRRQPEAFEWCRAGRAITPVGADLVRVDYRASELTAVGRTRGALAELLATSGLAELGFSIYGCTTRLGAMTDPASMARAAEVVILMHGFGATRAIWQPVAAAVCRDNAEAVVLVPDVPAFGESLFAGQPTAAQVSPAALVRVVEGLRQALGLGQIPAVVLGSSMAALGLMCLRDVDLGALVSRIALNPIVPAFDGRLRRALLLAALFERVLGRWPALRNRMAGFFTARELARTNISLEMRATFLQGCLRVPAAVSACLWAGVARAVLPAERPRRLSVMATFDDHVFRRSALLRATASLGLAEAQIRSLANGGHHPHIESAEHPEWTARNLAEIVHEINTMLLTARCAHTSGMPPALTETTELSPAQPTA